MLINNSLMLCHHLRRWPNIESALVQRQVLTVWYVHQILQFICGWLNYYETPSHQMFDVMLTVAFVSVFYLLYISYCNSHLYPLWSIRKTLKHVLSTKYWSISLYRSICWRQCNRYNAVHYFVILKGRISHFTLLIKDVSATVQSDRDGVLIPTWWHVRQTYRVL